MPTWMDYRFAPQYAYAQDAAERESQQADLERQRRLDSINQLMEPYVGSTDVVATQGADGVVQPGVQQAAQPGGPADRYQNIKRMLIAGVDNPQINQVAASSLNDLLVPGAPDMPSSVDEYNYAKRNGYQGSYMQFRQDLKQSPVTINNAGATGYLMAPDQVEESGMPRGSYWMDPIKGPRKISGYNQDQTTAAQYANTMMSAERNLDELVAGGVDPTSVSQHANILAPDWMANYVKTPEGQQYTQAQEEWVRAKLRKESGAVIGEEEMRKEIQTYFPQPGDDDKVVAQKAERRRRVARSLASASGGAYKEMFGEIPEASSPTLPATTDGVWDTTVGPKPGVKWVD